jgi:hypothetical protein
MVTGGVAGELQGPRPAFAASATARRAALPLLVDRATARSTLARSEISNGVVTSGSASMDAILVDEFMTSSVEVSDAAL